MSKLSFNDFENFFKYYKSESQQQSGIRVLYEQMRDVLKDDAHDWIKTYRKKPEPTVSTGSFSPGSAFSTKVTPNFTYSELCNGGEEARRFTSQDQCDIAVEICEFLEKARAKFGPIKITSGHRPPAINAAVGGASSSEHLYSSGCGAVDAYPIDGRGAEFETWCDNNWPYSIGYGMSYRGFVHIGIRAGKPRVRWDYQLSTSPKGVRLITEFEGLRLESYYCAANVLTIGYGHTSGVYEGQVITEEDAEELLRKDLLWFEQEVCRLIDVPLTQHEFDAIVSFTFNCGSGALADSTFRRRMNNGEDKATCFREEFPRWISGGIPGLIRRRDAEVQLATEN